MEPLGETSVVEPLGETGETDASGSVAERHGDEPDDVEEMEGRRRDVRRVEPTVAVVGAGVSTRSPR
ncbi:hypothetical protein ACFQE1_05430, partial [Halobium palmae]